MTGAKLSIRDAFQAFCDKQEPLEIMKSYNEMCELLKVEQRWVNNRHTYRCLADAIRPSLSFKQKRLFQLLDERWTRQQDSINGEKHVLISGCGPNGLRGAIEAILNGFRVTIVEKRDCFSRHNIIKTWQTTVGDLECFGLKIYYPTLQLLNVYKTGLPTRRIQCVLFKTALLFGVRFVFNATIEKLIVHTEKRGEARAQIVRRRQQREIAQQEQQQRQPSTATTDADTGSTSDDVSSTAAPDELRLKGNDDVMNDGVRQEKLKATDSAKRSNINFIEENEFDASVVQCISSEQQDNDNDHDGDEESSIDCGDVDVGIVHALLLADGERSRLVRRFGVRKIVTRFRSAVGLVINAQIAAADSGKDSVALERTKFTAEQQRSGLIAAPGTANQASLVSKLAAHRVFVENIEFMIGETYFLVATLMRQTLEEHEIVRKVHGTMRDSLRANNVRIDRLRSLARTIADVAGVPSDAPFSERHGVNVFDFSAKARCETPALFLRFAKSSSSSSSSGSSAADSSVNVSVSAESGDFPILPVGDALMAPYWPSGLGVNRGFHTTLDAVHALRLMLAKNTADDDDVGDKANVARSERAMHELRTTFHAVKASYFLPQAIQSAKQWTADPISRYASQQWKVMYREEQTPTFHNGYHLPKRFISTFM